MSDVFPVFHTGFHKTGTTYLQRRVWPACTTHKYVDDTDIKELLLAPYAFHFDASAVREQVTNLYGLNFIFSNEELSANPRLGGFNGFALEASYRRIHAAFPEARIVVFLRKQTDILSSLYLQYVKMGGTKTVDCFFHNNKMNRSLNPGLSLEYYEFDRMLDFIVPLFETEHVVVMKQSDLFKDLKGSLRCFRDRLNLDFQLGSDVVKNENVAMKKWSLSLSRRLNFFTRDLVNSEKRYLLHIPGAYRLNRYIISRLDRIPVNRKITAEDLLGSERVDFLEHYYQKSNKRLLEKYGIML